MMELFDLFFYVFAAIIVVSGAVTVLNKNLIYSAFALLILLSGVAVMFFLLGAEFLAMVQILIYVGGIMILVVFGIMLTGQIKSVPVRENFVFLLIASVVSGLLCGLLVTGITSRPAQILESAINSTPVKELGTILINKYYLIFGILGVLLLVILIAAAGMARNNRE
ncbi:MAG: NADH-quinone oxidoreductase subunit J [Ignavibacteriaceae bacterium]|nr:MAG: NADH-quinone oxidoreductase subunit J [Chlorobiota bacterium]GJQ32832.1 MAG: NADH-quinone oxidoreductase subunit J [Ignavibacteriaceae bacterium]